MPPDNQMYKQCSAAYYKVFFNFNVSTAAAPTTATTAAPSPESCINMEI
jgi:hypothetical protein